MPPKKDKSVSGEDTSEETDTVELLKLKLEMLRLESEERNKEREHEERMYRLKMEEQERLRTLQNENRVGNDQTVLRASGYDRRKINIPKIDDNCDPEINLKTFERACHLQNVPDDEFVQELLPFLGDKAMKAYARLSETDAFKYETVKEEIMKAFHMTPQENRKKFRNMMKGKEESYAQMVQRLKDTFDAWIKGSGVGKDYLKLRDLMLKEQFCEVISPELRIWLGDRNPRDIDEYASLADKYAESRQSDYAKGKLCEARSKPKNYDKAPLSKSKYEESKVRYEKSDARDMRERQVVTCYRCKKPGHKSYECDKFREGGARKNLEDGQKKIFYIGFTNKRVENEYMQDVIINDQKCVAYRDTGSFITLVKDNIVRPDQYLEESVEVTTIAGEEGRLPKALVEMQLHGKSEQVEVAVCKSLPFHALIGNDSGRILRPVVNTMCGIEEAECHGTYVTSKGTECYVRGIVINDEYSTALRDTGSNISIVRENKVLPHQFTGGKQTVRSVSGKSIKLPLARIKVDDGQEARWINVAVHKELPADMLLGNIHGPVMKPIINNCFVVTRSQGKRAKLEKRDKEPNMGNEGLPGWERREAKVNTPVATQARRAESRREDLKGEEIEGRRRFPRFREVPESGKVTESLKKHLDKNFSDSETGDKTESREWEILDLETVMGRTEFINEQKNDASLKDCFERVKENGTLEKENAEFFIDDGVLMRKWKSLKQGNKIIEQVVLPKSLRNKIMYIAHQSLLAGHLGTKKTRDRVMKNFYWPGIFKEISEYIKSCVECQKTRGAGKVLRAPLRPIPVVGEPFYRVGADIVGPLPTTEEGNRFILTVTCYATKYPEAIPLSNIDAERITEELIKIFTRVGFPKEVIVDNGKQFIAKVAQGLWRRTGVHLKTTTVYHPQTNGQTEKFNGTLKHMLRTLAAQYEKDWDILIPYALFAYREVPQESTGFSPFELLFGREVRGPLDILKRTWTSDEEETKVVTTYLNDLRTKMMRASRIAVKNLKEAQDKQKKWYDKKARSRTFAEGQEVLVIRPTKGNTLEVAWDGPYKVVKKISELNYEIELEEGNGNKIYHVNMIKPFTRKNSPMTCHLVRTGTDNEKKEGKEMLESGILWGQVGEPNFGSKLTEDQVKDLRALIQERASIFQDRPGRTSVMTHDIELIDQEDIKIRQYRVPWSLKKEVDKQIEKMLDWGIIEGSQSKICSPIVLVPKKDGENRFCVDFRDLNKKTKFDAFPTPFMDDELAGLRDVKFMSKIDLCRGFWQIPLTERAKELTAFRANGKLFHFNVMPFGLKNSSATFVRLMNKVLEGVNDFTKCYIDDILIYSDSWEQHIHHINYVLNKLEKAGLTAKPNKCYFGVENVEFLGHKIGTKGIQPSEAKIKSIQEWPRPTCKKQIKSFLGITGFYRRYIPNYADIAAPLTDQTKKNVKKFFWNGECEEAFSELKKRLVNEPILVSPKQTDEFVLQVDASDKGLGAVLCVQTPMGEEKPVAYLSRKLSTSELGYSTIEKEGLCLVWAVEKVRPYVYGKRFIIQTDHNPLVWMNQMRDKNRRVLRWALLLQEYDFEIQHKRGKYNLNADALSRQ